MVDNKNNVLTVGGWKCGKLTLINCLTEKSTVDPKSTDEKGDKMSFSDWKIHVQNGHELIGINILWMNEW